jgi:TM2 domain-containing membrane protein YozV/type II secretory pathway pseudopilin PulG
MTPPGTAPNQAAANPYAPPASAPAPGHKQCDTCGADILARAEICPKCGVRQHSHVSKAVLLLLTFFFGGIGGHKFYLGKWWQGALYLVFFWTGIPSLIALIEFIVYCFTSTERLNEKYSAHGTAALVLVIVAVVFGVMMIGILAAVAIPAYADYTNRARSVSAIVSVSPWRVAVAEHYAEHRKLPNGVADLAKDLVPQDPPERFGTPALGANGVITLTFQPPAGNMAGKTILFRPQAEGGGLIWDCTGGTLEPRYRPASCRAPR